MSEDIGNCVPSSLGADLSLGVVIVNGGGVLVVDGVSVALGLSLNLGLSVVVVNSRCVVVVDSVSVAMSLSLNLSLSDDGSHRRDILEMGKHRPVHTI